MGNPLVSIVMSVHNGSATLERALASVKDQTFSNYECVFIDDASTDQSGDMLRDFCRQTSTQCRVIGQNTNIGLTRALNVGIKAAQGQYIARLDADDWWAPSKLEVQTRYLSAHHAVGVLGAWYQNVAGKSNRTVRLPTSDSDIKRVIYRRNPFGHSTVLIRRGLLQAVGGYNERLRYSQDRDLWFRLMFKTSFANLASVLCYRDVNTDALDKRAQIIQSIKTTSIFIKTHRASPLNYFYLVEPLAVLATPSYFRYQVRRIRSAKRQVQHSDV